MLYIPIAGPKLILMPAVDDFFESASLFLLTSRLYELIK
jgi:hypothetical protein